MRLYEYKYNSVYGSGPVLFIVLNIIREILLFLIYSRFSAALGSKNSVSLQTGDIKISNMIEMVKKK